MKDWWKLYRLSTGLDHGPAPESGRVKNYCPRESDPESRALLAVHEQLQRATCTLPPPPPELANRICSAIRRRKTGHAMARWLAPLQSFHVPLAATAGLALMALALTLWLRPHPHTPAMPDALVWVSETQVRAQEWARWVLDPDLERLQRELEQTQHEARAALAHILASVP